MIGVANPDGVATHAHTAHVPGGGPKGTTCATCAAFLPVSKRNLKFKSRGRCFQWAVFRRIEWRYARHYRLANPQLWWRGWRSIKGETPSCKYYEPKPAKLT